MNKTININLGGIFFHIDENAYLELKRYLDAVENSLHDAPEEKKEILADIENRISELLSEKIKNERQVVNTSDINDIVNIMGQPEDYADQEEVASEKKYVSSGTKKLFRDPDDSFLGGVSSGIAHYIGIEPIWLRLFFILFLGIGTPVMYVLLWILLPQAKTTAEKLQMYGEAVNIENIEKKIKGEFDNISQRVKNINTEKTKSKLQNALNALGETLTVLFKITSKFIGFVIITVAITALISIAFFAITLFHLEEATLGNHFIQISSLCDENLLPIWVTTTLLLVVISMPFLLLIMLGLSILFKNIKQLSKTTSLTFFILWLASLFTLIFIGIDHQNNNSIEGSLVQKSNFEFIEKDTLILKMTASDQHTNGNYFRKRNIKIIFGNRHKQKYSNHILVNVIDSNTEKAFVKVQKVSEGRSNTNAKENASKIQYNYRIENNKILLDDHFISPLNHRYLDETVYITVGIPTNTSIYFTNSTDPYIYDIENTENLYDSEMINHYFKMTNVGLDCMDCYN